MLRLKENLSIYSIAICLLVVASINVSSQYWNNKDKVIASDVVHYYAYLPATFIFHDIKLENIETFNKGFFWFELLPNGSKVIKTSMGMSFLYAPFFFCSHFMAKTFGSEAYGFSPIYKMGLLISAFLYLFLGLFFLRKILKIYFTEMVVSFTLVAVTLGTNLIYYTTTEATMTHIYDFALINTFVWLTIKWYKKPRFAGLVLLGFLSGLITLIRPSNITVMFFFFMYGISSKEAASLRIKMIFTKFHWFVFMGFAFFIIWIPQMIYWKYVTGDFFVYTYPTERFYWLRPHFIDGLFSYRKGWLFYSPVMALALTGIVLLFTKLKEFSWAILVFIFFSLYIVFSWWCWWYGGSFGMRPMIDYYGVLAIPLALLFSEISKLKKHSYLIVAGFVLFFVIQSNFYMQKYKKGSLHFDSTTKASFEHSFWRIKPDNGYWELLKKPDYQQALKGIYVDKEEDKN